MDDALGQSSSEPSMNDLIAALDAAEAEEGLEEGVEAVAADPDEPDDNVDDDDTPVTVSQKELKELRDGQLRMKDYTQKTQEVAESRRQFEKEAEQIKAKATETNKQHEAVIGRLAQYEKFLQADLPRPPSAELATQNPQRYVAEDALYKEKFSKLQSVHQALENEKQAMKQNEKQLFDERVANMWEELTKRLPGWSNKDLATKEGNALLDYATKHVSAELITKAADPGFWEAMSKAKKYDDAQALRKDLKSKQTKSSGTTARPGVSQPNAPATQRQQKLQANWKASRSTKDALAMAEHMDL